MVSEKEIGLKFQDNAALSSFTTFKLGGRCKGIFLCSTPLELESAIVYLNKEKKNFLVIGEGSNLLVSDKGLDQHVIRYVSEEPSIEIEGSELVVSGSTNLDELALFCAERALECINFASGIPGTVGGAIVGNAGAFGQSIGDNVMNIVVLDKYGIKKILNRKEGTFSYRNSILKKTGDIVVSVRLKCAQGSYEQLMNERDEILELRREKHPDWRKICCAGSFFKNTDQFDKRGKRIAAGFLLDKIGAKSMFSGGARVFEKHANILIANKSCTSQDVINLSNEMAQAVREKFDVDLKPEVRLIGRF